MGFSQALSGLKAAATNLDVIGNNIANAQTVGFKGSRAIFSDIYAGTQAGLGAQVAAIQQDFTTGTLENTGRSLDIAISGTGFLRLLDSTGQIVYSRNGQLRISEEGYLVNAHNARLTGFPALRDEFGEYLLDANGNQLPINGGAPVPIQIPSEAMKARSTTRMTIELNLDNREPALDVTKFDKTKPETYTYANNIAVYDSQGTQHNVTVYFVKTDNNQWEVFMAREGEPASESEPPHEVVGTLGFTADGVLPKETNLSPDAQGIFGGPTFNLPNGAAPIVIEEVSFVGSSQFARDFTVNAMGQDGYAAGTLVDVSIDKNGNVIGTYSNEKTRIFGSLALANFRSPEGLRSIGDNAWVETSESGVALLGKAGTGLLGSVESGLVEASNVDLTRELINLIIAQRQYQANSQTIKVQDEVLQNAVNL